jgi:sucrose phosphorylase
VKNQVQLITYVDRLAGGGFPELTALLQGPLAGLFGGVHILPFFDPIDGADAGFDPVDHTRVDPRLGDWSDVRALGAEVELVADLIVNHIARQSPQCRDFLQHGAASAWRDLILTRERVFADGVSEEDLKLIYRPRPGLPFTKARLPDGCEVELWTTFTPDQVDIDVEHPLGQAYLDSILQTFAANGVKLVRLDAVGYAIKRAGTSCFMLPETFAFISELTGRMHALGMQVLVEIHSHYRKQVEIARQVDWVYDFALPPLVLHAFALRTAAALQQWIDIRPHNALTVLDTHDGIGIIDIGAAGDEAGLVPPEELDQLVEWIHNNSQGESRQATGAAASNLDLYQVNCTFFDALGRNARHYLLARAIQFFLPGIPQVYYVGLLAGRNDMTLLHSTKVGRDINRHYYKLPEITAALQEPVVASLCELIRLRNTHPAFLGEFRQRADNPDVLALEWHNDGQRAELRMDFSQDTYTLRVSAGSALREVDLLPTTCSETSSHA